MNFLNTYGDLTNTTHFLLPSSFDRLGNGGSSVNKTEKPWHWGAKACVTKWLVLKGG
jgi:hypothetical protein